MNNEHKQKEEENEDFYDDEEYTYEYEVGSGWTKLVIQSQFSWKLSLKCDVDDMDYFTVSSSEDIKRPFFPSSYFWGLKNICAHTNTGKRWLMTHPLPEFNH